MTTKIFCLFPGLDVQDGISHRGGETDANDDQDFLFVIFQALTFKTVSHIGAAKPVRMTTRIFCLFPGLDVQDGISHQAAKPVRMTTRIFSLLFPGLDVQDGISHQAAKPGREMTTDSLCKANVTSSLSPCTHSN